MTKKNLSTIHKYALASANQKVVNTRVRAKESEEEFNALLNLITDELGIAVDDRNNWRLSADHTFVEKKKDKGGEDK